MSPTTATTPGAPGAPAGAAAPPLVFELPPDRVAVDPAEVRGTGRDDVRLMVARRAGATISNRRFPEIVDVLAPGDLVVVNTSATIAAALPAIRFDGTGLRLHLSTALPGANGTAGERWLVELRLPDGAGSRPFGATVAGEALDLPAGGTARVVRAWKKGADRLWVADLELPVTVATYLAAHGAPVRYTRASRSWPLAAYQTVYSTGAAGPNLLGSAEMPSAGRAFTAEIVTRLVARGVGVAPLVLHAGVSSPEAHEAPSPEWFRVPPATARWVNATRESGGTVVAVGTSVVRALETVGDPSGRARPGEGWTELVVGPERGVRVVDGLLTGWHEPEASHLRLIEAVAGRDFSARCYRAALDEGYLWHEFGDLHLILP